MNTIGSWIINYLENKLDKYQSFRGVRLSNRDLSMLFYVGLYFVSMFGKGNEMNRPQADRQ